MARIGTKMRYFKIPLCRNFVWKVRDYSGPNDTCQWCLRSKIGVWQMPIFKFIRPKIWRWNLWFDWSKRLKYEVHHFWPKMLMNAWDAIMNARWRGQFDWDEKPWWDTWIRSKRDPTPLGDSVVSLEKIVVYYCTDRCMKTNWKKKHVYCWCERVRHYKGYDLVQTHWGDSFEKKIGYCELFAWHEGIRRLLTWLQGMCRLLTGLKGTCRLLTWHKR